MQKHFLSLMCFIVLCASAFALNIEAQEKQGKSEGRILVGPNLLVSRNDADVPHVETAVEVNPRNKKNLLGASMVFTREVLYGVTCKTYASRDGGQTWTDTSFPERFTFVGDPQVAYGLHGTAYFICLSGGETFPLYFYRSEDGGFTWDRPLTLRGGDHPQMVVDQSTGRFANRVYFTAMYGVRKLAVSRSEDDGKTFIGPVEVPNPRGFFLLNMNPLTFSDGTLFIPYLAWDDTGGRKPTTTVSEFVTSADGGVTFSQPTRVLEQPYKGYTPPTELRGSFATGTNVVYAIDRRTDRLYVASSDDRSGARRMIFAVSANKGKTWSAPRLVSPAVPAASEQYQPMLAVNHEGTVGVAWFDTRNAQNRDGYDLYFTASTDGGETFLPARKISSALSLPISAVNLTTFQAHSRIVGSSLEHRFRTAFGRWGNGGDYMGFTAEADGRFRPFWIDSRSGVFQIWTTQIQVTKPGDKPIEETSVPPDLQQTSVTERINLVIDPPQYNLERQEATLQIRLRNISNKRIYGPFKVKVKKSNDWTFLSAGNNQSGANSVIDYSAATGDWQFLEPGALTEAVIWKFKYSGLGSNPNIQTEITGYVSPKDTK